MDSDLSLELALGKKFAEDTISAYFSELRTSQTGDIILGRQFSTRYGKAKVLPQPISNEGNIIASSWTSFQKWQTVSTAWAVCFAVSIDSTAILSASEELCHDFHIDQTKFAWSVFLMTAWTGAAAILPLFLYPIMEDFGIRKIYLVTFFMFIIFVGVQAVTPSFAGLLVARFFAGSVGGVLQNAPDGIASDLWGDDVHRRAFAISMYVTALLAGIIGGSVFGGTIELYLHWRWIFYIELMMYAVLFVYAYFTLGEPRPGVRCADESTDNPNSVWSRLSDVWTTLRATLTRGLSMLFTEFIVGSFTMWSAFAFGTVFMMAASVPQVCMTIYDWSEAQGAIFSTPFLIGALLGGGASAIQDLVVYPRLTAKRPNPEARLYLAIPATFIGVVGGIFMYAWTAYPSTHWSVLAVALGLAGFGVNCIIITVGIYITDCYSLHAASAISAVAFGENCIAAFLPLATRDMYTNLGFQMAGTILGLISLLLCMAPILLVLFGERIRARSSYLNGSQ